MTAQPKYVGDDDIDLTLTWAEVLLGAHVGMMRNVQSLRAGRKSRTLESNLWTPNIEGALGELALAKHLNVFWTGAIGDIEASDVAGFEVRTNSSRAWDDCIIKPSDKSDKIYVSALCFVPRFILTGWILCADAKQEKWWKAEFHGPNGVPAWFVPRASLHPMTTLPRL